MQKKNQEIEALRAVAVLMVLVDHLGALFFWGSTPVQRFWNWAPMWTGVDLFFCISGYVITLSLADRMSNAATKRGALAMTLEFWIRRFWRLFPSAWLWLVVMAVCSVAFNSTGAFGTLHGNIADAISVLFQVSNFHFFHCYSDANLVCGKNGVYWSLSVEEQFYLLFPLILAVTPRRFWPLPFIALALSQLFIPRPVWSFFWSVRTDAIALGVLLALAKQSGLLALSAPEFLRRRPAAWMWLAALTVLLSTLPSPAFFTVPFSAGLASVVAAILIWSASFERDFAVPDGLLRRALTWVGARSYALYLIHWPVFIFTRELWARIAGPDAAIGGTYSLRFALTAFPLMFILADMNYRLVEQPLRRHGARIAARFTRKHDAPVELRKVA